MARLSGDQFALILLSERDPGRIIAFAENIRRTIRAPITFNDREIFLTASIGLCLADAQSNRDRRNPEGRRACDVSFQAHRRRPHRSVQGGDARAQVRPPDARIRTAPRAGARGDQDSLPADRSPGGPHGRRLRGAGALGSSEARAAVACRIHQHRRRDRPDRRSRHVRAGAHRAPTEPVAAHGAHARGDLRQRQRIVAPVAAAGPDPGSAHGAGTFFGAYRNAEAGTHRIHGDGKSRACRADADAVARAWRRPRARRFRHRPFVAVAICSASRSTPSRSTSRSCA